MQFKKSIGFVIVAVFATFSCVSVNKNLGEDLVPPTEGLEVKVAEIEIPFDVKLADSLQATSSNYVSVGVINTKETGLVEFSSAANIAPIKRGFRFGKDPMLKSVWFSGIVANKSVLNDNQSNIPQNIFVYKLNKELDTNQIYNNSLSGDFYNKTPLNAISSTYFGGDSIKVFLNNSLGASILSATEQELDSVELFEKRFGGLLIKCSAPEEGLYGGRINMMSFTSATINIRYNFQPTWQEGLERKDTVVKFGFGSTYCLNLSSYNTTGLQTTAPSKLLPIEGVAGVKPHINHQKLKAVIEKWIADNGYSNKNIIVNKASILLPFEIPANYDMSTYPTGFFFARRYNDKGNNKPYYYMCRDIYTTGTIGTFNRSLSVYEANLPSTIQSYIDMPESKLDSSYDLWFFPAQSYQDSNTGNLTYYLNTDVYLFGNVNGNLAEKKPTLKMIYTITDK